MATLEEVRSAVKQGIRTVADEMDDAAIEGIGDDDTFSDIGLDSLDQMNLLLELEKSLGANFDDVEMERVDSINRILAFANGG